MNSIIQFKIIIIERCIKDVEYQTTMERNRSVINDENMWISKVVGHNEMDRASGAVVATTSWKSI